MIRMALPKGRNLDPVLKALRAAGAGLEGLDPKRLSQRLEDDGLEVLLLKDWDLPLYVEYGIADCGFVGTDVLEEVRSDLLVPLRLEEGRSRFSIIGKSPELPPAHAEIRVATKYPGWTQRLLSGRAWGAEVFKLSGSVELGPLLDLAEFACDIVQTGSTIREHDLFEIEVLAEVAPCLVVNRASFQQLRAPLNDLMSRLEAARVVG